MSAEFWYGVVVSAVLFAAASAISIFSTDIRQYYRAWWNDRRLRGTALKINKLEQELRDHENMTKNPATASAFFWAGLFLVIVLLMLLGLVGFLEVQLSNGLWRALGAVICAFMWFLVYTVANSLYKRAQALSRPASHAAQLGERLNKLRAKL
ncbi:MAG TPA: hypothetical protein VJQ42_09470 [Rhodanobacteraceae bacterium]|nr:hypothetical protein [Rhodanobacteraceae bacterium]